MNDNWKVYYECPFCQGLLTKEELLEMDRKHAEKIEKAHCPHCKKEFEGIYIEWKPIYLLCDKHGKSQTKNNEGNLICAQCENHKSKITTEIIPKGSNEEAIAKFQKDFIKFLKQEKSRIGKGEWYHCGQVFKSMEEFINHLENCVNTSNYPASTAHCNYNTIIYSVPECSKCNLILSIIVDNKTIFQHDCQAENITQNNYSEITGKTSRTSISKWNEPGNLVVLGSGIIFIAIGVSGLIYFSLKKNK